MNADLGRYDEFGYCLVRGRSGVGALGHMQGEIQGILDKTKSEPGFADSVIGKYREFAVALHMKCPAVAEYLRTAVFLEIARELMGADADLRFTSTLTKTAERGQSVDWHQDHGYEKDPGYRFFTCWIAVTDSVRDNGCLRIIPQSHAEGLVPHIPSRLYPTDKEIPEVDESRAVDAEMEAGDILVLHPHLFHASGVNTSGRTRMSLIAGFQEPKAKYLDFELKVTHAFLRNGESVWSRVPFQDRADGNP